MHRIVQSFFEEAKAKVSGFRFRAWGLDLGSRLWVFGIWEFPKIGDPNIVP